ncbi:MAG: redoxin domain-containing protein [Phycisphaerae bacterium]|nr:redoxin domain-containing protein [Phycisphaerae bacterium]
MRQTFAIVAVLALSASALAQETVPAPAASQPGSASQAGSLGIGSKAPALAVEAWVKGQPVESFEAGRIYVIEIWATWCAPCIAGIGHLTGVQREYKDHGVQIIGLTSADPKNMRAAVESFVAVRGDGMGYTVAWDAGRTTYERYMIASRHPGIPACFVVGKDGTIEYIGHPQNLDLVIPKLVDGTWDRSAGPTDVLAAQAMQAEVRLVGKSDPKAALVQFAEVESRWPLFAKQFLPYKASLQRSAGDLDGSKASLARVVEVALERHDFLTLRGLAAQSLGRKAEPGSLDEALSLATAAAKTSNERDAASMRILAKIHQARGDLDKAIEAMKKSVETAGPDLAARMERELRELMK